MFRGANSPTPRHWKSYLLGSIVMVALVQAACYGSTGRFPRAKEALNLKFRSLRNQEALVEKRSSIRILTATTQHLSVAVHPSR